MSKKSTKPSPGTAFIRASAGYDFAGKTLQPFTGLRQAVASKMGLRFGMVDEKDIFTITVETLKGRKKEKTDLQFYNQMYADIVTVIWLCSVPVSRVLRAYRKIDEATEEAFAWADKQGITLTSAPYFEAAGVFFTMMQDISVSTAVPKDAENGIEPPDEDDDPNE